MMNLEFWDIWSVMIFVTRPTFGAFPFMNLSVIGLLTGTLLMLLLIVWRAFAQSTVIQIFVIANSCPCKSFQNSPLGIAIGKETLKEALDTDHCWYQVFFSFPEKLDTANAPSLNLQALWMLAIVMPWDEHCDELTIWYMWDDSYRLMHSDFGLTQ